MHCLKTIQIYYKNELVKNMEERLKKLSVTKHKDYSCNKFKKFARRTWRRENRSILNMEEKGQIHLEMSVECCTRSKED